MITPNFITGFLVLVGFASCKTSGDLRTGRDPRVSVDPSGVKTLEAPPSPSNGNSGYGDRVEGASGSQTQTPRSSNQELERQLEMTQGELENLRHQLEKERQEWALRKAESDGEKKKLADALAARPEAPVAGSESNTADDKSSAELLWKQSVDAISNDADAEALVSLKSLLVNYPKSKRLWGATLTAGMVEYRLKNFKGAAIHFNQAIDMSSKRNVGPSLAWYFQGLTFLKMNKKEDAALFLGELDRRFAKTPVNIKARRILAGKMKAPADLFYDLPNWLDFVGP